MRTLLLAGAAALSLAAFPTLLNAQGDPSADASAAAAASYTMTPEQQAMYDAWPADRQMYYNSLDAAHKAWFWSLTPRQMEGYWAMTADQRAQVFAMEPAERANAWTSIEAQLAAGANDSAISVAARTGTPVPGQATTTVTTTPSGQAVVTTNIAGNLTPPPASALNKTYPVCTRRLQDNCQNPGEGGAPGKSRALGYWPGEPASERRERGG